ncbi:MAG: hypothetical protein ACOY4F_06630 [Thermodesulfobacteriota bacterium]
MSKVSLCLSIIKKIDMSITQLKIGAAVTFFTNQPTPILFVDTCAILDILRLPFRENNPTTAKSYLDSAQHALQLSKSNNLRIIILPNVPTEYSDNFQETKNELSRHISKSVQGLKVLEALHLSRANQLSVPNLLSIDTEAFLEKICNDFISNGIHIFQENTITLRATNRVIKSIPPSRKGTIKDCIIYEHGLEICSLLRKQGFTEKIVFLTSNTKDYCDGNGYAKKQINDELSAFEIRLCLNWSWAINDLYGDSIHLTPPSPEGIA